MASPPALGRLPAPLIAVAAAGAGLPVGLLAVAWIALDGWGAYRDRYHLGHLLGAAVVTLFVLCVAGPNQDDPNREGNIASRLRSRKGPP
jgi:hypothetical protein